MNKSRISDAALKQENQLPSFAFSRDSRQVGVGSFIVKKRQALIGGCWSAYSGGRLIEMGHLDWLEE